MKSKHELSEIVHEYGKTFLQKNPQPWQKLKTLGAFARCGTAFLGGHKCMCISCGKEKYFYNFCSYRHCPKCQAINRERWIAQHEAELPTVPYFHVLYLIA
jgi:hypothetical protein